MIRFSSLASQNLQMNSIVVFIVVVVTTARFSEGTKYQKCYIESANNTRQSTDPINKGIEASSM